MKESHFQNYIVRVAKESGWLVQHTRRALAQSGRYMTPIQGHTGFPDLTLVSLVPPYNIVFAELKQDGKYPKHDQRIWLGALGRVQGDIYVCVWRPRDMDQVVQYLTTREGQPPGIVEIDLSKELEDFSS